MMSSKKDREIWKNKCINLFQKKKYNGTTLRCVSDNLRVKFPNLREDLQSNTCRFKLTNLKGRSFLNCNNTARIPNQDQSDIDTVDDDDNADNNECDPNFPIPLKVNDTKMQCDDEYHKAGVEVLDQIIEKLKVSKNRQEKFQLLSLAPKSWGRRELRKVLGTSERQAIKVKPLVSEHGILILPNPKKGRALPLEIETLVRTFYERDDISRMMPGMKDFVSVKNDDGTRSHVQKRLLLCSINKLYAQFTAEHEGLKISILKFTKLRPRHCVLAGSSGSHNVCVCMHQENTKLILNEIDIQHLTADTDMS